MKERRRWKCQRHDSHIPTAATKPWKSGKPKPGFPLSHSTVFLSQIQNRKEPGGGVASRPPPGSSFDENMLGAMAGTPGDVDLPEPFGPAIIVRTGTRSQAA